MFKDFFFSIFLEKSSYRFVLGVLLGLAFSIAVILSTIGIMDGFVESMQGGLKKATGDLSLSSNQGFFSYKGQVLDLLEKEGIEDYSGIVQSEGFVLIDEVVKGVLIKGVNPKGFNKVSGLSFSLLEGEIILGKELSKALNIKKNDQIRLLFGHGNKNSHSQASMKTYRVREIISHDIYKKDMRIVYVSINELQRFLNLGDKVNKLIFNIPIKNNLRSNKRINKIKEFSIKLDKELHFKYRIEAYWEEFSILLKAVEHEKFLVGLILQLIVIVSVFNVLAFIIFANERYGQEVFLFTALGMSQQTVLKAWYKSIFLLWVGACIISIGLVQIFGYFLRTLNFFQLPGDIYQLGTLEISLELLDYILVFGLSFIWLFLLSWLGLRKVLKNSILHGLRREFA